MVIFINNLKAYYKVGFVLNVVPAPVDDVGDQKRIVLLPEEVGEEGFLESSPPTFRDGLSPDVVARLWNRFQETGNVRRRPGASRPRTTTSTNDRCIQLTARPKQNRECYAAAKTVALGNKTMSAK
ncbi:hypothetical protein TNCV_2784051 [Trichonephila clavipes]|nr:hypothetical protein TNCV_2784051 [Trichonephila clavipes]